MYNVSKLKHMEGSSDWLIDKSFLKIKPLVVDSTGYWSSSSCLKSNNYIFVKTHGVTTSSVFSAHSKYNALGNILCNKNS